MLRQLIGKIPEDLNDSRSTLDERWDISGQAYLVFGSDWPNSDLWMPHKVVFNLVQEYFSAKGPEAHIELLWKNLLAVYRWV